MIVLSPSAGSSQRVTGREVHRDGQRALRRGGGDAGPGQGERGDGEQGEDEATNGAEWSHAESMLAHPRPCQGRPAVAVFSLAGAAVAAKAPEGTLTIAMHFTPVTRWLDPAEGERTITPYLLLYTLHDALLKPMPGVRLPGPSLAESWSMAKAGSRRFLPPQNFTQASQSPPTT